MDQEASSCNQLHNLSDESFDWMEFLEPNVLFDSGSTHDSLMLNEPSDLQHNETYDAGTSDNTAGLIRSSDLRSPSQGAVDDDTSCLPSWPSCDQDIAQPSTIDTIDMPFRSQPVTSTNFFDEISGNILTFNSGALRYEDKTPLVQLEEQLESTVRNILGLDVAPSSAPPPRTDVPPVPNEIGQIECLTKTPTAINSRKMSRHDSGRKDLLRNTKTSKLLGFSYTVQHLGPQPLREKRARTAEEREKTKKIRLELPCLPCRLDKKKCSGGNPCKECRIRRTRLKLPRLHETDCVSADTTQFNPFAYDDFDLDCLEEGLINPLTADQKPFRFWDMFSRHTLKDLQARLNSLYDLASFASIINNTDNMPLYSDLFHGTEILRNSIGLLFITMNRFLSPMGQRLLAVLQPEQARFVRVCRYAASAYILRCIERVSRSRTTSAHSKYTTENAIVVGSFMVFILESTNDEPGSRSSDERRMFMRLYLSQLQQFYTRRVGDRLIIDIAGDSFHLASPTVGRDLRHAEHSLLTKMWLKFFQLQTQEVPKSMVTVITNIVPMNWVICVPDPPHRHGELLTFDNILDILSICNFLFGTSLSSSRIELSKLASVINHASFNLISILLNLISFYGINLESKVCHNAPRIQDEITELPNTVSDITKVKGYLDHQDIQVLLKNALLARQSDDETATLGEGCLMIRFFRSLCHCCIIMVLCAAADFDLTRMCYVLLVYPGQQEDIYMGFRFLFETVPGFALISILYPTIFRYGPICEDDERQLTKILHLVLTQFPKEHIYNALNGINAAREAKKANMSTMRKDE